MSDYERSIRRNLAYLSGVADALIDTHPNLGECIANVVCEIEVDVFEALADALDGDDDVFEQDDLPTAEDVKGVFADAAESDEPMPEGAPMYMGVPYNEVIARSEKDACDMQSAARAIKFECAGGVIGSASEVSDEAVRAAGGTPEYSFGPRTS